MTVLYIALAVILAAAGWYVSLLAWPLKPCPRCQGSGKRRSSGAAFGACGRCGRSGEVRRIGARRPR